MVALGANVPAIASAQDRIPAATGSGEGAAFRAQGVPLGAFRLYPTLRLSTDYQDNLTRSNDNKRGDGSVIVAPAVAARSNWSRNQLSIDGYYRSTNYFERTEQDHDEYGANVAGRLDVKRTTKIYGSGSYTRLAEPRGTPGDLFISNGLIRYRSFSGDGQISHQFNRIGVVIGAGAKGYRYDDAIVNGVTIDQKFRDRNTGNFNGRVEYQYSAATSLFVSGSYNKINYDSAREGFDRSSQGYTALAGVRFELSRLLSGQIGVGYIKQKYRNGNLSDFSGINYDVSLSYKPTQLTSMSLAAGRHLTDSSLRDVAGVLTNDVNFIIDHELLRSVSLQGFASYTQYTYRGIDRKDDRFDFGMGARYRMNRYVSLALSGDRLSQDIGFANDGRRYTSNRVTLSLILAQ